MDFFRWLNSMGNQQPTVQIPDGAPAPPVRRGLRFSGIVQGVGFRYEVQRIAAQLGLTGWVRNQGDGSVAVEIEGPSNFINSFLLAVEAVPRFHITDIQSENLPLSKSETAFQILY